MTEQYEAGSRFEEEGILDLQDGTPQESAGDPQAAPIPGEGPLAVEDWGTTAEEQVEGEPLDLRLSREEPDEPAASGPEREQDDEDVWFREEDIDEPARLYQPTTEHAGRIVEPDEGVGPDTEPTAVAQDVGADDGGYTAEERAMRVESEEEATD